MREPAPISNYVNGSAIHLSLQGKGVVGKSFIASILAQYFLNRGHQVQCIDTDPVNICVWPSNARSVATGGERQFEETR